MVPEGYPHLQHVLARQLAVFPDHGSFLRKRFSGLDPEDLAFADAMADKIARIAGDDLDRMCGDYRWLCDIFLEEELHFRRTGRYRITCFAEAVDAVYSNPQFMSRYMDGLLMTQLWWRNHMDMLRFFHDVFLPANPAAFSHLDIGPGHGLFLHLAATAPHCGSAEAWDVSATSLTQTRMALDALGGAPSVRLTETNLFAAPARTFQSVACCEVVEHLDAPLDALRVLRDLLTLDGRLFVTTPVNAPAPDHVHLFNTPEEIIDMVRNAGLEVLKVRLSPTTGTTLDQAKARKLSISVAVIAARAP